MKRNIKVISIFQVSILLLFFMSSCDAIKNSIPSSAEETMVTSESETEQTEETTQTPAAPIDEQKEGSQESTDEPDEFDEAKEHPYPEFFDISWLTGMGARYNEGAWDELLLEEKYNVDFKVWNIHSNDTVGLKKMLAAGDIPDVGLLEGSPLTPKELHDNEFTRSVPLSLISEHFMHYYEKMLQNRPYGLQYNRVGNSQAYYGLSVIDNTYLHNTIVPVMRLDWLDSIGQGIAEDYLTPISLTNEKFGPYDGRLFITNYYIEHNYLNEIFKAFTVDDPDKNGINDTFGAVIWPHTVKNIYTDLLWGQFGIISSDTNYLYRDWLSGDIVPYYAHAGYMDYMKWADEMRKKGYARVAPSNNDELHSMWMKGKTGFFTAELSEICNPENLDNKYVPQSIWVNTDDEATFVILPALKGPGNDFSAKRSRLAAMSEETGKVFTFGRGVSDEKLARIFTIWNDYHQDPFNDFSDQVYAGVEGIHFTWSGEPYNSTRILMEEDRIPIKYRMGKFWINDYFGEENFFGYDAQKQILTFQYNGKWMKKYGIEPYKYINVMQMGKGMYEKYVADYESVRAQIDTIVNDFAEGVWKGGIKLTDSRWDSYIEQLYEAGLRGIVDTYYNNIDFPSYQLPDFEGALRSFHGLK